MNPEQMFGWVSVMVHMWISAGIAPASALRNPSVSVRNARGTAVMKNWKMAKTLFLICSFLILFSGFTLVHTFASASGEPTPAISGELVISVESGDTLWSIARTHKNPALDTRQAVEAISERNRLASPLIQSGQELIIPAKLLP
jgi:nucleoid-associated protein YgaU